MKPLTEMQQAIYDYIAQTIEEKGYPPSVREIGAAVGLASPSTVHFHLNTLEQRGLLRKEGTKNRTISLPGAKRGQVPILGVVTAGQPILAIEDVEGYLPYDAGYSGEYFALRVRGDSMIDAGILEGDYVVVRKQPIAENGQIVVALIGDEATVKRLKFINSRPWLYPENPAYEPIDGSEMTLLGLVKTVIREY